MTLPDAAGMVGVLLTLAAYAAVQMGKLQATGATSLAMNMAGSGLILVSLCFHFNLAGFAIEAAWAAISAAGLVRVALKRS